MNHWRSLSRHGLSVKTEIYFQGKNSSEDKLKKYIDVGGEYECVEKWQYVWHNMFIFTAK